MVNNNWWQSAGLSDEILKKGLMHLAFSGIDDGDIFLQNNQSERWTLSEHKVKTAYYGRSAGLGVRAIIGEQTGFAYADSLQEMDLLDACKFARKIQYNAHPYKHQVELKHKNIEPLYLSDNPIEAMLAEEKIKLLKFVDEYAYQKEASIIDLSASFQADYETVYILNIDGRYSCDVRPLVRFNVSVVIEKNGRRESGYAGGGARDIYQNQFSKAHLKKYVDDAINQALINSEAVAAPAGEFPVILANGWPGVLLHEAVGHGLEGDFNRKGSSVFSNRIGEKICSELCTVIDDGTLYGRRGSLSVDDEGTPTARNVLIENGVLKGYMQDRMNGRLMGGESTGNGRRQSYSDLPMPRMTNTYLAQGKHQRQDMIKSVKKGIYAEQFGGGQVNITNGQFVFVATQAWLIEDGKVTVPIKGVTLIGNGPDVMKKISMVGDDLALDGGIGICGKNGQSVPVGVGQPSLKVDSLTVGGTDL